jgi:1-acyl-sn-glycerol-3-phosphate acyltransferase
MPPLERLTDINLDDLFDAAGLMRLRHGILQRLLRPSARRFAQVALSFDRRVATLGQARGSAWLVHRMAGGLQTAGVDAVPVDGPTVILANHPGMVDTVALLASLACRPDLLVIARDRPFLRSLPNVARHLILVPDDDLGRVGAVRACVRHLKRGGAVLTFPAGEIEPDPATAGRLGALDSVLRWSDSLVLFARRVPSTRFVPAIVSNVVSPEANRHVLTLLRRSDADRARLAAALQVCLPRYRKRVARVAFGAAHGASEAGADALRTSIVADVRRLIDAAAGPGAAEATRKVTGPGPANAHRPRPANQAF